MSIILVVAADPDLARSRALTLTTLGLDIVCEHEGRRAVAAARTVKFRAVLVDQVLPDLRGDEVCDELRLLDRKVPIFLITDGESRALDQWAKLINAILLKHPIDESQLVSTVEKSLSGRADRALSKTKHPGA